MTTWKGSVNKTGQGLLRGVKKRISIVSFNHFEGDWKEKFDSIGSDLLHGLSPKEKRSYDWYSPRGSVCPFKVQLMVDLAERSIRK
jgi:hypothetical protein